MPRRPDLRDVPVLLGPGDRLVTADEAATLYRLLRDRDQEQRAAALAGRPVDLELECLTQTALLLVEPHVVTGGLLSAPLVELLADLHVARVAPVRA